MEEAILDLLLPVCYAREQYLLRAMTEKLSDGVKVKEEVEEVK